MKNCMIIVNYNDYKSTKHLLDNIKEFDSLAEIVIVDNSSKEEEREELIKLADSKITILLNEENVGYSSAINIGADYLIKKYQKCNLIISNSDIIILSEEDLLRLLELLAQTDIGLVGPQILENGKILRGRKDCTVNFDILSNLPLLKYFIKKDEYYYKIDYFKGDFSEVDVISTCFFLISSEVFQRIHYMDENIFLYYEDFILGRKVRNLGLKIVVCNNVKIKHLYSVSVDKNYKSVKKKKIYQDSMLYYHTNYHKMNFFQKILLKFSAKLDILWNKGR